MELSLNSTVTLNNGVKMPCLGLGVFATHGEQTRAVVRTGLEYGYRLLDTARVYCNEVSVGKGIADSGVPRDQIFVTSKLWRTDWQNPREGLMRTLDRLHLQYLDLFLLHWPFLGYIEAYRELEKLQNDGLCRAIGVSNFKQTHLEALLESGIQAPPQVNQTEIHPMNTEEALVRFCREHGIAAESYSPLGGGGRTVLDDPRLIGICNHYHKTPAQVVLRWHLQRGLVVIPKSSRPERILSNSQLYDFDMSQGDLEIIGDMDNGERRNYDPDKIDERPWYLEPRIVEEPA